MAKNAGHQVMLFADMAGGTVYTEIGQVMDISGPGMTRDSIEVTTRDSVGLWNEFIKGFKDGGELTFGLVLDTSLATHGTAATGLLSDFADDTTIPAWELTLPQSRKFNFDGFLTSYQPTEPMKDALTADITVKVTADITEAAQ